MSVEDEDLCRGDAEGRIGLVPIVGDSPVSIHLDKAETRRVVPADQSGDHDDVSSPLEMGSLRSSL